MPDLVQHRDRPALLIEDALPLYDDGFPIIPLSGKVPVRGWKKLQTERPSREETIASLDDPRVDGFGVPHWQGLVCRDYDDRGAYEQWSESHAGLAAELPTVRTSRGMRVYATAPEAAYVGHLALGDGELIAGANHYSIMPRSAHPGGGTYVWVNPWRWPPPEVNPTGCGFLPKSLPAQSRTVPYPPEEGAGTRIWDTWTSVDATSPRLAPSADAIDTAIARTLPTGPGQRDLQILELVRALRRIGIRSCEEGERHLRTWWELAYSIIRTKRFDVTLKAFRRAWNNFDPALDRLEAAIARSRCLDPPADVVGVYQGPLLMLASLCRELQRIVGPYEPFLLARQDAARGIGIRHARQAGRYLETLRADGLLQRMHPGFRHKNPALRKATKWLWLVPLQQDVFAALALLRVHDKGLDQTDLFQRGGDLAARGALLGVVLHLLERQDLLQREHDHLLLEGSP